MRLRILHAVLSEGFYGSERYCGELAHEQARRGHDVAIVTLGNTSDCTLALRSQAAKNRLAPALTKTNLDKTIAAPVVAILAFDLKFYEHLPRMYHNPAARSWYETTPEHIHTTSFRNATLQGAYFILAARALGLCLQLDRSAQHPAGLRARALISRIERTLRRR